MDNNFLLTYNDTKGGITFQTFQWFETEQELRDYVKEWQIEVVEATEIMSSRELKF